MNALQLRMLLISAALCLGLACCQSPHGQQLSALRRALEPCTQASEWLQDHANEWSRLAYLEGQGNKANPIAFDGLLITPTLADPLKLPSPPPLHWSGLDLLENLSVFNTCLLEHLQCCQQLEDGSVEDLKRLEQSAKLLAQSANGWAKSRGSALHEGATSTLIRLASEHSLQRLRRRHLHLAMVQLQPLLDQWLNLQRELLAANRAAIQSAYATRSAFLLEAWQEANAERKPRHSTALLDLNDLYAAEMRLIAAQGDCLLDLQRCCTNLTQGQPDPAWQQDQAALQVSGMRLLHCCAGLPKRPKLRN